MDKTTLTLEGLTLHCGLQYARRVFEQFNKKFDAKYLCDASRERKDYYTVSPSYRARVWNNYALMAAMIYDKQQRATFDPHRFP